MASSRFAGPSIRGLRPPAPYTTNIDRQSGRCSRKPALKGSEGFLPPPPYLPCADYENHANHQHHEKEQHVSTEQQLALIEEEISLVARKIVQQHNEFEEMRRAVTARRSELERRGQTLEAIAHKLRAEIANNGN